MNLIERLIEYCKFKRYEDYENMLGRNDKNKDDELDRELTFNKKS